MLNVTITGDRELIVRLSAMPAKVHSALLAKVWELALKLEAKVKNEKLSGQVLNHKSGNLWRSIFSDVQDSPSSVTGKVATSGDVKYAAIHEFGGYIPAHEIEAKNAQALSFFWQGQQMFAKKVYFPGAQMPERSFLRSSLSDMKGEIVSGMTEAVNEGLKA